MPIPSWGTKPECQGRLTAAVLSLPEKKGNLLCTQKIPLNCSADPERLSSLRFAHRSEAEGWWVQMQIEGKQHHTLASKHTRISTARSPLSAANSIIQIPPRHNTTPVFTTAQSKSPPPMNHPWYRHIYFPSCLLSSYHSPLGASEWLINHSPGDLF